MRRLLHEHPSREDGAAGLFVLALAAVLAAAAAVATALASVAVSRHEAASAADLAALAAADQAGAGRSVACRAAGSVAAAAGAEVLSCRLDGGIAQVSVQRRPVGLLGGVGAATSTARAGPAFLVARGR